MKVSLDQQIEEVEREIELRKRVYPHQVASKKMRQSVADYHMERMECVLQALQWLRINEGLIREDVRSGRQSGEGKSATLLIALLK